MTEKELNVFKRRRQDLMQAMNGGVAIIATSPVRSRIAQIVTSFI